MLYVNVSVQLYEQDILTLRYISNHWVHRPACYGSSSVNMSLRGQSHIEYQPVITSPGGHPNKDGRSTDSCFALMRVHQSCLPMDGRMTNATTVYTPPVKHTCGFNRSR